MAVSETYDEAALNTAAGKTVATDSVGWTCQQIKRAVTTNALRNGVAADTSGNDDDVARGRAATKV